MPASAKERGDGPAEIAEKVAEVEVRMAVDGSGAPAAFEDEEVAHSLLNNR